MAIRVKILSKMELGEIFVLTLENATKSIIMLHILDTLKYFNSVPPRL